MATYIGEKATRSAKLDSNLIEQNLHLGTSIWHPPNIRCWNPSEVITIATVSQIVLDLSE
jgi:hypothetical protein